MALLRRMDLPLALLASLALVGQAGCSDPRNGVVPRGDVVLVVVDTLRADALSAYGNPRATSPALDRLAAGAVLFEEAYAQAPNTATSHASLFTGEHPGTHLVANLTSLEQGTPGLPDGFETLAERFAAAGYRTVGFSDGGPLGTTWNLDQGFQRLEAGYEGVAAKVDQALAFLDEREGEKPLFLFLHTYQVHLPYAPPAEFVERFGGDYQGPLRAALADVLAERAAGKEQVPDGRILMRGRADFDAEDVAFLRALYDGEVATTDRELARLWRALEARERWGETLVALTSDHGEEFGEHGHFGHVQLHRETLRVPLIVRFPGAPAEWEGRRVSQLVSLVDLHATLLEAVDLSAGGSGTSLLEGLRSGRFPAPRSFAQTTEFHYATTRSIPERLSLRRGNRVYLETRREGAVELVVFDPRADPDELEPLGASGPEGWVGAASERALAEEARAQWALRERALLERRARLLGAGARQVRGQPSAEELEALQRLGYVEDGG